MPKEVTIDGVRYAPVFEGATSPSVAKFRDALLDVWWGEDYRGSDPDRAGECVRILIGDGEVTEGCPTVDEFCADLAAKTGA